MLHLKKISFLEHGTGLKEKERYQGASIEQKIHQQFPVLTLHLAFREESRCLHLMSINRYKFSYKSACWCRKEGLALCYIPRHGGVHGECRVGVSEAPMRDGVHMLALPEDRRTALKQLAKAKSGTNRCSFLLQDLLKIATNFIKPSAWVK